MNQRFLCLLMLGLLTTPVHAAGDKIAHINTEQYDEKTICNESDWVDEHQNLTLVLIDKEPVAFDKTNPWYGPDGKHYLKIIEKGSDSHMILINRNGGQSILITVNKAFQVTGYWTSISTVVIEAWWGRIAETEFNIDVENNDILVAKDINYGPATMSHEEACSDSSQ